MRSALSLAALAEAKGEVPVGAILVLEGKKIGEGLNSSIHYHDPTAHAEILALRQGGKTIGNYRITGAVMYVTLEPCLMCIGAMIHARISRIAFGAKAVKNNEMSLCLSVLSSTQINHNITLCPNILAEACSLQLSTFFKRKRNQQKNDYINNRVINAN
ncbi:cytidine/deoxycytidylate deaminase family protein [Baumannia cicadellinicola str. Hc (Homalodisca coagulata)]|uniref:tRNA-specific adenosine deaminase n=2 Tax=Candidatus Palibaumannia cicadellinicola TaxID=186490 RepID=Q1LU82_BAUCH|nr:cytidine/deoxycytidylate deaminase family protein [Baumannia cicadellinicola str. Hc (Homalodisca coagulata)]